MEEVSSLPSLAKDRPLVALAQNSFSSSITKVEQDAGQMEKEGQQLLLSPPTTCNDDDLIDLSTLDAVLAAKLKLVNDAQDYMGWTHYQSLLFLLCGFGYATDSMLIFMPSALYLNVAREFPHVGFPRWQTMGVYIGLFLGAIIFGLGADATGRKWIFNISLATCAIFTILAGVAPSFPVLVLFSTLACLGGGGNLVLDTTIYCEWCPSKYQWTMTLLAMFWGIGQLVGALLCWVFVANFSCPPTGPCTTSENRGWRYASFASGGLVMVMSITRLVVLRLHETPKWLVAQGRDDDAIGSLNYIANRYKRPNFLTRGHLRYLGDIKDVQNQNMEGSRLHLMAVRFKGLFANRQLTLSTLGLWLLWLLVGIGYPVFNIFLPTFLLKFTPAGQTPPTQVRILANTAIAQGCSTFGPVIAAAMCAQPYIGRRRTMAFGAVLTAIFMFAWTRSKTSMESVGFPVAIGVALNLFYGTLYGYTTEVLPAAYRATGMGLAVSINRIGGIIATLLFVYAQARPDSPLWASGALFLLSAVVALLMPFEPTARRPV